VGSQPRPGVTGKSKTKGPKTPRSPVDSGCLSPAPGRVVYILAAEMFRSQGCDPRPSAPRFHAGPVLRSCQSRERRPVSHGAYRPPNEPPPCLAIPALQKILCLRFTRQGRASSRGRASWWEAAARLRRGGGFNQSYRFAEAGCLRRAFFAGRSSTAEDEAVRSGRCSARRHSSIRLAISPVQPVW
jgi:hypothetical protein